MFKLGMGGQSGLDLGARITMAPDGRGGGGDEDSGSLPGEDDDVFFDDGVDDEEDGGLDGNDDINLEEEFDPDLFWGQGDEDEDSETPEQRTARVREEEKALADDLRASIESFSLPEDVIPEDFNPNDPHQFRSVLADVQRQAIQATMGLMFKPIQAAMRHNNSMMRDFVQGQLAESSTGNRFESLLEQNIPAVNDPARKPVIQHMAEQARKRFPNDPAKAIQAVKQSMRAVGVSTQFSGSGRKQSSSGSLDSFFPDVGKKAPTARARNRLKKR